MPRAKIDIEEESSGRWKCEVEVGFPISKRRFFHAPDLSGTLAQLVIDHSDLTGGEAGAILDAIRARVEELTAPPADGGMPAGELAAEEPTAGAEAAAPHLAAANKALAHTTGITREMLADDPADDKAFEPEEPGEAEDEMLVVEPVRTKRKYTRRAKA